MAMLDHAPCDAAQVDFGAGLSSTLYGESARNLSLSHDPDWPGVGTSMPRWTVTRRSKTWLGCCHRRAFDFFSSFPAWITTP